MRDVLKGNSRGRNTSSVTVKALPGSKITADPELSKIATTTLTSVKQHMEVAFPILNDAGITVDNLKQAVSLAGGIVQFMKDIAGGKTLGGIDRKKLGELWNQQTNGKALHREELKNLFRAVMPGHHEWIPSNYMLEVIDRDMDAGKIGEIPKWIDLQNQFRVKTSKVIFGAEKVKNVAFNGHQYAVFQGHVGSKIYLQEVNPVTGEVKQTEQFSTQDKFHNQLRDAFSSSMEFVKVISSVNTVIDEWFWDGVKLPINPIHTMLRWNNGGSLVDISKDPGLLNFKNFAQQNLADIHKSVKAL
jgi:hypothetical protein